LIILGWSLRIIPTFLQRTMRHKATLYPIYAVATQWDDEPFDVSVLPFAVAPNISVEDVSTLFNGDTFGWVEREMGRHDLETLKSVQYAVVHRYETEEFNRGEEDVASEEIVRIVAACLRLIRPMRQGASLMQGEIKADGSLDVQHFEHPINLMEVPEVQKLFHLRNRDLMLLQQVAPQFLTVMKGDHWKIRMAVQFHEGGHWQQLFWKPRLSLWTAGVEALYTAPDSNHSGRLVTTERIKHLLGADTPVYEQGDFPRFMAHPDIRVQDVLKGIYKLRNYVVHGERVPPEYADVRRQGVNAPVNRASVALEALSFVLRKSILHVFTANLLEHFKDSTASRRYWSGLSLTRDDLLGRGAVVKAIRESGDPLSSEEILRIMNKKVAARAKPFSKARVDEYVNAAIVKGELAVRGEKYVATKEEGP
jgi:hypothetical protein